MRAPARPNDARTVRTGRSDAGSGIAQPGGPRARVATGAQEAAQVAAGTVDGARARVATGAEEPARVAAGTARGRPQGPPGPPIRYRMTRSAGTSSATGG